MVSGVSLAEYGMLPADAAARPCLSVHLNGRCLFAGHFSGGHHKFRIDDLPSTTLGVLGHTGRPLD